MGLELKTIRKFLNKAFFRETIHRNDFDQAVLTLRAFLQNMDQTLKAGETEEHYKFFLPDFFKGFNDHYINTGGYTDLVIHNGSKKQDLVYGLKGLKKEVIAIVEGSI